MELSVGLDYVRANTRAVLHTYRRDGRPQLSPVTVALDAEERVIISSRETAIKVHNLRRDPRASLCVFPDRWLGRWVQLDGTTEILSLPDALEPLVEYYRGLRGEHPDWDDYRRAMVADQRLLIRMTLERVGPDRQG
ncbi:MAG: PPOX class F420-dependent oxidoreductase [Acidimicrobiales bacterium]|nr:PPOX class F420-dependent oxidoreductase [Acidimicrobiales bacterium]